MPFKAMGSGNYASLRVEGHQLLMSTSVRELSCSHTERMIT